MEKAVLTELLLTLVAAMFGVLVAIFGWLSKKLYEKLDYMNLSLRDIESSLIDKLHGIDRRVTKVETEQSHVKILSIKK